MSMRMKGNGKTQSLLVKVEAGKVTIKTSVENSQKKVKTALACHSSIILLSLCLQELTPLFTGTYTAMIIPTLFTNLGNGDSINALQQINGWLNYTISIHNGNLFSWWNTWSQDIFKEIDQTGKDDIDGGNLGPENKCHLFSLMVNLTSKSLDASMQPRVTCRNQENKERPRCRVGSFRKGYSRVQNLWEGKWKKIEETITGNREEKEIHKEKEEWGLYNTKDAQEHHKEIYFIYIY